MKKQLEFKHELIGIAKGDLQSAKGLSGEEGVVILSADEIAMVISQAETVVLWADKIVGTHSLLQETGPVPKWN